jgi:spore coat polysaccharide biosynthesis protein SpsF
MRIGVIVQARMTSRRLPGKVLMNIAEQKILDHIINSYSKIKEIDKIVIATSEEDEDSEIVRFVE